MRRIIPYIASHYQNDRIWLRRSKPSKMHYQLLIAMDDSSSMQDNECKQVEILSSDRKFSFWFLDGLRVTCCHKRSTV